MGEEADFYKGILDNLYDGVYFVNRQRVITYWNKGAERITGYKAERVIGHACHDNLLNHVNAAGEVLCLTGCPLAACMEDGKPREVEVFLRHLDGQRLPVLVRAAPLRDAEGRIIGAVETFSSDAGMATVRHELRHLRRTVDTDLLTGVANRRHLERRLRGTVAEVDQQTDAAALLFIDIDDFKQINDMHGHTTGDKILRVVASTLKANLRETDMIGRWGGDEFLAILYDLQGAGDALAVAEKLCTLVEVSQCDLADGRVHVTLSIGVTMFEPLDTPEAVVRRTDALMYQCKQAGGNRVSLG